MTKRKKKKKRRRTQLIFSHLNYLNISTSSYHRIKHHNAHYIRETPFIGKIIPKQISALTLWKLIMTNTSHENNNSIRSCFFTIHLLNFLSITKFHRIPRVNSFVSKKFIKLKHGGKNDKKNFFFLLGV